MMSETKTIAKICKVKCKNMQRIKITKNFDLTQINYDNENIERTNSNMEPPLILWKISEKLDYKVTRVKQTRKA